MKKTLDDILAEDDELGLLDVKPVAVSAAPNNLLAARLSEINEFYATQGRPPLLSSTTLNERLLAKSLTVLREDTASHDALLPFDEYGLLTGELPLPVIVEEISKPSEEEIVNTETQVVTPVDVEDRAEQVMSLDDIFADDDDGLLSFDDTSIFTLKHVPHTKREKPDEIASRQPCAEFPRFERMFETVKNGLATNEFSTVRFRQELGMQEGDFFIFYGVLGYVNKVGERLASYKKWNARLHLVFENGTEMDMLFLSLMCNLAKDDTGRKLSLNGWTLRPDDVPMVSGTVYVVTTKSTDPALQKYKPDLYKIGFTKGSVEERLKHAEQDMTFLEAPVEVVMTTHCFNNVNAQKLEMLIHAFLGKQKLNVTIRTPTGKMYRPSEWFHVSLDVVKATIEYILDGTIVQYRMNNTTGQIVKK